MREYPSLVSIRHHSSHTKLRRLYVKKKRILSPKERMTERRRLERRLKRQRRHQK